MKSSLLLFLAVATGALAQTQTQPPPPTFDPRLAPLAQKHQAGLDAIKAQDDAATARHSKAYLDALASAEKSATFAGQLKTITAVDEERQSMKDGLLMPVVFPAGLPSTLKIPRQNYLDGLRKIASDSVEHQQRLNEDYLRNLARLAAAAPAGSELATQIAAEKASVLNTAATVTNTGGGTPTGTNKIVNGNFTTAGANGIPKGWLYDNKREEYPKGDKSPPPGLTIKAMEENKETFVRLVYEDKGGSLKQAVEVPPRAKEIIFRARVRGKQTGGQGHMFMRGEFYSKDGKNLKHGHRKELDQISPNAWHTIEVTGDIPAGAASFVPTMGSIRASVSGTFDFKGAELKFR